MIGLRSLLHAVMATLLAGVAEVNEESRLDLALAFLAAEERAARVLLINGAYEPGPVLLLMFVESGACIVREKFFVGVARARLSLLVIILRAGLFNSLFTPIVPAIPTTFLRTLGDFWRELRNLSMKVGC